MLPTARKGFWWQKPNNKKNEKRTIRVTKKNNYMPTSWCNTTSYIL
jgi:hypothetical protein